MAGEKHPKRKPISMDSPSQKTTLMLVGLGAVGGRVVSEMAASPSLKHFDRILLIDPDRYTEANLNHQEFPPDDVGRYKVASVRDTLAGLGTGIDVETYPEHLQALPLGVFRKVETIVSGLDSRRARVDLNERAFRTGVPVWIDAGVSPDDGGLVRITCLRPRRCESEPCFECGFQEADYAVMGEKFLCADNEEGDIPTEAPAELGQLAAERAVAALDETLEAEESSWAPWEHMIGLTREIDVMTRLTRNPNCRFSHLPDPEPDSSQGIDLAQSLGWFFERVAPYRECGLRVEGAGPWVRQVACLDCGDACPPAPALFLANRELEVPVGKCPSCGGSRVLPVGFESRPFLWRDEVRPEGLSRTLKQIGIRPDDEITFLRSRSHPEPIFRLAIR